MTVSTTDLDALKSVLVEALNDAIDDGDALDEYDAYPFNDGFDALVLTITDYFSNNSEAQTGAIQGQDEQQ